MDQPVPSFLEMYEAARATNPDFGKVRNACPREAFAFNVSPPLLSVAEITALPQADYARGRRGHDDYRAPVHHVPLDLTSHVLLLDFCRRPLILLGPGATTLTVGDFVWEVVRRVAGYNCPRHRRLRFKRPVGEVLAGRPARFVFLPEWGPPYWRMIFLEDGFVVRD